MAKATPRVSIVSLSREHSSELEESKPEEQDEDEDSLSSPPSSPRLKASKKVNVVVCRHRSGASPRQYLS